MNTKKRDIQIITETFLLQRFAKCLFAAFRYFLCRIFICIHIGEFGICLIFNVDILTHHVNIQSHHDDQHGNKHTENNRKCGTHLSQHLTDTESCYKSHIAEVQIPDPACFLLLAQHGKHRSGKFLADHQTVDDRCSKCRHNKGVNDQVWCILKRRYRQ